MPLLSPLCSELGMETAEMTEELGSLCCPLSPVTPEGREQWIDIIERPVLPTASVSWDCSNQIP